MCRILAVRSDGPVDLAPWLDAFAEACRTSKEDQSHGWGLAWWEDGAWRRYRSVEPIWETELEPPRAHLVLVHARSAFRNEGIVMENNMPFLRDETAFAFNGELRGVRLSAPGDTGAARLEHLLHRFTSAADGDLASGLARLDQVVLARSEYVRALNVVVSDGRDLVAHCRFGEDPGYFTLRRARVDDPSGSVMEVVCSEPLSFRDVSPAWSSLENGATVRLDGSAGHRSSSPDRGVASC